jgi:biopolymer transport protein ExbB
MRGLSDAVLGDKPTFFEQFVVAGGPIVWVVLLPLSVITLYLAVEHFLTIRRRRLLPDEIGNSIAKVIRRFGVAALQARLADRSDLVSVATCGAMAAGRGDWFRIRNALAESLQDQAARLFRRIEWLNLIGNVSPMVGLFGTVYGMIKLFNAIVSAGGQPQTTQLAEGISIALVTTFWGRFIAIPALAIHGVLRNRIQALANDAVAQAEVVVSEIRRGLERQKLLDVRKAEQPARPVRDIVDRPAREMGEAVPLR